MDIIYATFGLLTEPWVLLVLVASVMFAAGNHIDEELLKMQEVGTLVIISGLFGLVLMAIFFTATFVTDATITLSKTDTLKAIGVGVLELTWVIPYLYATKRRGAVVAGPLFQGVPVIVFGLEAMGGTIPPVMQIGGALLLVLGGILLSIEKEEDEDGEISHTFDWKTFGLMAGSAFIVALIYVWFKDVAENEARFVAVGFWSGFGMFLTGVVIWLVYSPYRRDFNEFAKNVDGKAFSLQFFNELLDAGGVYLVHLANLKAASLGVAAGVVTSFSVSQPIAIALLGALLVFFGYKQPEEGRMSWLLSGTAILLIAAGTVVIAL